jgi:hypothetical protein
MGIREATQEEIAALELANGAGASGKQFDPIEFATGLARSVGQGITFGFADEAEAYARSFLGDENYKEARNAVRADLERFRGEYPFTAYGSEIAASMIMPGGSIRTLTKEGIRQAAKKTAAGAGLYGAGAAEEIKDVPLTAATSGAMGYGLTRAAPSIVAGAKELAARGVPLTAGQKFGGVLGGIEERLTGLPVTDFFVGGARMRGVRGFERAAYNEALQPIGKELPKGLSERGAYIKAEEIIGKEYADTLKGAVIPTPESLTKYADTSLAFLTAGLPQKEQDLLKRIIKREITQRSANGKLSGEAFKDAQSAIRREAYKYMTSSDAYQKGLGEALSDVADELTNALAKSNPDKAARLAKVDAAYSRFKPMQMAAGSKGQAGAVTPSKLLEKVYSQSRRAPAVLARGEGRMQELAETGVDVLGSKIGDPGTAGRLMLGGALLGGGAVYDPVATALTAGGLGALYSRPGQAFMRGAVVPAVSAAMRQPATAALLSEPLAEGRTRGLLDAYYP